MTRPAIDLHDPSYLALGTQRQRQAFAAIEQLGLFAALAPYNPALAGTIPLDVDVAGSDLDVICRAADVREFSRRVRAFYDHRESFVLKRLSVRGVESVVASFTYEGWGFELFAQNVEVAEQLACLHLVVEDRLLRLAGESARDAIRELKRQGMKTELAFANYFGITGDPYEELARLARAVQEELQAIVGERGA